MGVSSSAPGTVLAPKYDIDFAAPKGPNPPVDESSVQNFKDDVGFLSDETVKQKFANAKKLSDVNVADYDAIFYVGGHGPVIDLAQDPVNAKVASEVSTIPAVKNEREGCNAEDRSSSKLARSPPRCATDLLRSSARRTRTATASSRAGARPPSRTLRRNKCRRSR